MGRQPYEEIAIFFLAAAAWRWHCGAPSEPLDLETINAVIDLVGADDVPETVADLRARIRDDRVLKAIEIAIKLAAGVSGAHADALHAAD